ncbi:MAG TPA: ORF6N domain-containing protein, partial [Steroidobacteraceae bacterium]|nr:ORF6N domain-containing protein [Steroidobacteraceae bacterium]
MLRSFVLRCQCVILDAELAAPYGVTTKRLDEQVKRNAVRFPEDFLFRLSAPLCVFRPSRSTIPAQAGPAFRSMPGRCEAVCGEWSRLDVPSTVFAVGGG